MDETPLFLRAQQGNMEAVEVLYRRYYFLIVKIANRFKHLAPVEDLIQEGTVQFLKSCQTFDTTRGFRFSTYFQVSVKGAMMLYLRSRHSIVRLPAKLHEAGQRPPMVFQELPEPPDGVTYGETGGWCLERAPSPVGMSVETRALVRAVLAQMEPRDQEVLTAHFYGERSMRQISEDLGVTYQRVQQIINRAKQRFQDLFPEECI